MKKYGLIFFLSLVLTGLFAEEWTVATSYNTKFSYEDIVDIFIEECEKTHFDYVMWTYKVYTEESDQNFAWKVMISNDGYTYSENGEQKKCPERSIHLLTTNGWLSFRTFKVSSFYGTYNTHDDGFDDIDEKYRADFLAESFKWLQRYDKSWDTASIRAFDKLFEYTDYTNMLSFAAGHNLGDIVLFLIKNGADVNARDSDGDTALHYAVRSGNRDIARFLVQAFADVDVQDDDGFTPLMCANNSSMVQLLLQVGADVNIINKKGKNALWYVDYDDVESTKLLVKSGIKLNPENNSILFNWLGYSFFSENFKIKLKIILDAKKECLDENDLQTALIIAAFYNQVDKIQELINKGADVNKCNIDNLTPLMLASLSNSLEAVEFLVKNRADVNYIDSNNRNSAARIAVNSCSDDVAEFLIKNGLSEEIRTIVYRFACDQDNLKIKELIINYDNNEAYKKEAMHNIEVMIDGKPYYYFMTDDKELFKYELAKHFSKDINLDSLISDMRDNPYLSENVKRKMEELGCCYSFTRSNHRMVLNYYRKDEMPRVLVWK